MSPAVSSHSAKEQFPSNAQEVASSPDDTPRITSPPPKKQRPLDPDTSPSPLHDISEFRLQWSADSCAYDSVTMILGLLILDELFRRQQVNESVVGKPGLDGCPFERWHPTNDFTDFRDSLWDWLTEVDLTDNKTDFPSRINKLDSQGKPIHHNKWASAATVVEYVVDATFQQNSVGLTGMCGDCGQADQPVKIKPELFFRAKNYAARKNIGWVEWITRQYAWEMQKACNCTASALRMHASGSSFTQFPGVLWLRTPGGLEKVVLGSTDDLTVYHLNGTLVVYRLAGIVYKKLLHHLFRYIARDKSVWEIRQSQKSDVHDRRV